MCIIFGWWHIALILGLYGLVRNVFFVELVIFGVIYDALFRMTADTGIDGYIGTIVTLVFFVIYSVIKGTIRK